ncbi:MAG: hypothetical protein ABIO57_04210 [Candidatus Paceibacterota bacterium]
MNKYIIPTLALAIGITVIPTMDVSAASLTSAQIITKSDTAISARITSLNKLSNGIARFKHLTDDQRASINSSIQSSVSAMTTLKAKIDADTDLVTLKADAASITKDYRIYALVMPSDATLAAADNAMANIATYQTTLVTLQTRITASTPSTSSGQTTKLSIQSAHDDAIAKLTDATTKSQALITAITGLKPDMGDKTIAASNKVQIEAAKTARKAMTADIVSAKKDIATIRAGLKTLKA